MLYAASIRTGLDSLCWGFDALFNVLPSPIYVLAITYVPQSCKPVWELNLIKHAVCNASAVDPGRPSGPSASCTVQSYWWCMSSLRRAFGQQHWYRKGGLPGSSDALQPSLLFSARPCRLTVSDFHVTLSNFRLFLDCRVHCCSRTGFCPERLDLGTSPLVTLCYPVPRPVAKIMCGLW